MFNCLRHPDKVIISDPVGVGEEMSARMSGAAGIWSEITDDNHNVPGDHKTQSELASDARSEHARRRRVRGGDNTGDHDDVETWSRRLTGSSTVTQEVFPAI